MRTVALWSLLVGVALVSAQAAPAPQLLRIGVLSDGPLERAILAPELVLEEARSVLGDELKLEVPEGRRLNGNWTRDGIRSALDQLLNDPQVDVVLTLGLTSSYEAAHRAQLQKPVIAPFVIDPVLQGYPLKEGRSGRHNFVYIASFEGVADEIRLFHKVTRFQHLVALVDRLSVESIPELTVKADQLASELKVGAALVPVTDSVDEALARLPAGTDAVYVAPLLRLTEDDFKHLAEELIKRKLPSFSVSGHHELEQGLLLSVRGAKDEDRRLARRMALNLQRIADGVDPADMEVGFTSDQRLAINMRTARAIGFSPRWADLTDAEQLYAEETAALPKLSLIAAMQEALRQNPTLQSSELQTQIAAEDVRDSRSVLLPQLNASAQGTQIDKDRASPQFQAEKTGVASLELQQLIYSDRAWGGLAISKALKAATDERYRQSLLDTLESTATSYLDLLRAHSVENVRRANVENTRINLDTSRVREAVGLSERSDYLRWVSQINVDRQNLLTAESNRRQAEVELARNLHRPVSQPFATVESGLDEPTALVSSPRTQAYIDTPAKWAVFQEFAVADALAQAPELKSFDEQIKAQERAVSIAQRAYYLPELALQAAGSNAFERSGAGSQTGPLFPDEESWNVTLQATLPLFTGGQRRAEYSRSKFTLRQLEAERFAAADGVEARTRAALHRTAASWPSIELSQAAASAARENLAMVRDAYAKGALSVTDLIDAQDASLEAELGEAEAKYTFLIDFIAVLRATGSFDMLLDPASSEAWYQRIDAWFREHGQSPPQP